MLGRKNPLGAKRGAVVGAGGATVKSKAKDWREQVKEDEEDKAVNDDINPQLTEKELEDFRKQTEKEEREERLQRAKELLEKKAKEEQGEGMNSGKKKKKKKKREFAWMDSEDDEEAATGNDDNGSGDDSSDDEQNYANGTASTSATGGHHRRGGPHVREVTKEERDREQQMNALTGPPANRPIPACFAGREHLYKTKICQKHLKGYCQWGDNCHYAHGTSELRTAAGFTVPPAGLGVGGVLAGGGAGMMGGPNSFVMQPGMFGAGPLQPQQHMNQQRPLLPFPVQGFSIQGPQNSVIPGPPPEGTVPKAAGRVVTNLPYHMFANTASAAANNRSGSSTSTAILTGGKSSAPFAATATASSMGVPGGIGAPQSRVVTGVVPQPAASVRSRSRSPRRSPPSTSLAPLPPNFNATMKGVAGGNTTGTSTSSSTGVAAAIPPVPAAANAVSPVSSAAQQGAAYQHMMATQMQMMQMMSMPQSGTVPPQPPAPPPPPPAP
ncbi:unnamed protein product [Amoebophrya sp. A120]|nr:unnamed protein product [Amoebophrya sp. A120]|eukprot:GSA120T00000263001.1